MASAGDVSNESDASYIRHRVRWRGAQRIQLSINEMTLSCRIKYQAKATLLIWRGTCDVLLCASIIGGNSHSRASMAISALD